MVPSEDADESAPRTRAGLFTDESTVSNAADVPATPAAPSFVPPSFVFSAFSAVVEFDDVQLLDSADAAAHVFTFVHREPRVGALGRSRRRRGPRRSG